MKRVARIVRRDVKGVAKIRVKGHAKIAKHVKRRARERLDNAEEVKGVISDNRDVETV